MVTHRRDDRNRSLLAQECARLMAEEGVKDFKLAKRKAGERLGLTGRMAMPSNAEIEQALLDHQRLFQAEELEQLHELRAAAVEVMGFLDRFQPCLVGPVLRGIVSPVPEVHLHVFADTSEDVMLFLMEHGIRFETSERRMRTGTDRYEFYPVLSFGVDGLVFDLTIFTDAGNRVAPKSPVDGKPMRRADLSRVRELLTNADSGQQKTPVR